MEKINLCSWISFPAFVLEVLEISFFPGQEFIRFPTMPGFTFIAEKCVCSFLVLPFSLFSFPSPPFLSLILLPPH